MKKVLLLIILCFTFYHTSYSYDYLTVQDPQNWRSSQGTIDQAELSIKPQGIYMEYGLYLTFSAKNSWYNFNHNDTLEVQFFFDLPEGAIVHDLWLWVGNDIMKALIMDKWTASTIYENIVSRRRDPAILFKRGANSYELRIFPMAGDESRKIKLTYLVPSQWNANAVSSPIPANLLRTSITVPKLTLYYWPDTTWRNPRISEYQNIAFTSKSDSAFGDYMSSEIPSESVNGNLTFEVNSPLKNGLFVSRLSNGNEGLYQLAMIPGQTFGLNTSRKTAILVDYSASKSNISASEVLSNLESMLKANFTEKDSFNLIFSGLEIKRIKDHWISGDSATIENVFDSLGSNPISSYSNLPSLLNNGIEFINEKGGGASILLISNSDQAGDYRVANPLIKDLKEKMDEIYPVYIVDFLEYYNSQWYYLNDRSYYGNEYFFDNFSKISYGEYFNIRNNITLSTAISEALQSLNGFISSFDFYTTLQNGFCFGRFNIDKSDAVYLNKPLVQVGKFNGSFPFIVQVSGVFNSETFSTNIKIEESDIITADTLIEEIWAGNYIKSLESQQQTNSIINEIVDYSISERVLSVYTALIALEPSDSVQVCYDCMDETTLSVEDDVFLPDDSLLQAYPNPFNSQVTIKVKLPLSAANTGTSFKIYNIVGEVIKTLDVELNENNRNYELVWNGDNDQGSIVSSGIYLFVMETPRNRYSVKLMHLK